MPTVYQQATATVTATPVSVHVGDAGTLSLTVANTASAGATSEALIASARSLTGGFSLGGFTRLSNAAGSGGTVITGINDDGTVIGYYLSPSTGTGTGNQNAATAGTLLPTSFTWTSAAGYTTIAGVAPETGTYGNNSTIPPGPDAPNGYSYIASGISGGSAVSYFGAGANPVFNGTIVLGSAIDYTGTATGNPVYNGPATVDSAQARFSGSTAYATFTTPAYLSATFLAPNGYYNGPGISQSGAYASLTKVLNTGSVEAVGDYGTALVPFDLLATQVNATNSWATGVNDSHVYVGTYQNSTGYHGFTGTVNATGTFVFGASFDIAGATNTYLMGIDNNGDFVGYFTDAGGRKHGFADVNGVVSTIDIGTGTTVVTGINDSGTITGYTVASGSSIDVGFVGAVPQTAPIAAGASSNTLKLAFSTAQAGTITGTATLGLTSDGNVVTNDTNGLTALAPASVTLSAVVYNTATAAVSAPTTIVHVGDAGTLSLTVANTASAGATSEALIASARSLTGGFSLGGFTRLSNAAGSGGTVITGINDDGTVIGYYLSPSTGTGTGNQNAATAGTLLPTSFTWTSAAGYTTIAGVAPETGTYGNNSTIPPGPDAPNGYSYIASGISGGSAVSYFGAGANPVFNGTIVLGSAIDYTGTATGNPVYNGPATVDSAQARFSGSTAYATFTTPAYLSATFLAPNGYYNGPGISQNGSYASLTKVLNTGSVEAVGDYGTALVPFDLLATQVNATNSWATGVNDSHVYVGTYQNSTGYHGFTGTVNATGTFVFGASFDITGATNTYLMGIDNNGDFVGYFTDAGGRKHGFADVNGVVSTIDIGTGTTVVTGINDSGIITGYTVASGSSIDVGFVGAVPQTAPIAAGASSNTLKLAFSTAQAGTITGTATLGLTSDGNVLSGNTLGLTNLGTTSLALAAVVNNYATAALQETAPSTATITQSGTLATVNLGTVLVGNTSAVVKLKALNTASGASDLLSGSFVVNGGTGFTNTGLAAFTGLAAGQADSAPTVTLNTGTIGTFTETITLQSTGSNSSGYSGALANQVVTITGTVVAAGSNTTQGAVSIPTSSSSTLAKAQSVITGVSSAIAAGAVATISSPSFSSALTSPSTPTVLQVGGGNPVALGAVNLGTLNANVTAVLINNTGSTTAANTSASTQQSVVGGTGGLSFTDAGTATQLVVGGGTNSVNFAATSTGASFTGDGLNTLTIAATSGTTTIVGTGASADTIRATSTGAVNYTAAAGSTAVVSATSGNVTIIGTAGATQTVFGGSGTTIISDGNGGTKTFTQAAFTGTLAASNVQGYAEGGTAGTNRLSGGSTGSSTLVGGGAGDTLVAGGAGDQLVARARGGNTTLDGSQTAGGINLWADVNSTNTNAGAVTMYGSRSVADNFYLSTSTVTGTTGGTTFKGSLISLHTSSTGTVMNSVAAGTIVNNTIDVGVFNNLAQFATVTDFVSGHDRLVIGSGQGAVTIAQSGSGFVVSTAQGSTITLAGTIALGDISRI